jgi:glycosidase
MTLSYDFAFLALIRLALSGEETATSKRRCLAHPLRKRRMMDRNDQLDFCSYAAALLTYHKLIDDISDEKGVKRLKIASIIQYTVYGVPNLYYADEAGMEGFRDPFNRIPYPWGIENEELLEHYRALGKMRASEKVFRSGSFGAELISESAIRLVRADKKDKIIVIANRESYAITESLDGKYKDLVGGELYDGEITVDADTAVVLKKI